MATLKELRLRIKSLKNTKKITSAMKMVSASKLKKAKIASLRTKPYIDKLNTVLNRVIGSIENLQNPFLEIRDNPRTRYILFTSDRGLCGGFNNNLIKYFNKSIKSKTGEFEICTIGKKAHDGILKSHSAIHKNYEGFASNPVFESAKIISDDCISDFKSGKIGEVVLCYNKFISTIRQTPTLTKLLPYSASDGDQNSEPSSEKIEYIFEPDKEALLREILPKQISILLFQAVLDNAAGEHAARMTAMENATNNASDLISTITIQMNRARQAAITTELTEIVSGAESLK